MLRYAIRKYDTPTAAARPIRLTQRRLGLLLAAILRWPSALGASYSCTRLPARAFPIASNTGTSAPRQFSILLLLPAQPVVGKVKVPCESACRTIAEIPPALSPQTDA